MIPYFITKFLSCCENFAFFKLHSRFLQFIGRMFLREEERLMGGNETYCKFLSVKLGKVCTSVFALQFAKKYTHTHPIILAGGVNWRKGKM